jgi:hypothetical protein
MGDDSSKDKNAMAGWWDTVSHHPLWAGLIAILLAGAITAHFKGVFGGDTPNARSAAPKQSNTKSPPHPLHVEFRPAAPVLYSVAFSEPIGLPKPSEDWDSLHRRGAIDVGGSVLRLTLANQTPEPVTVTNIEAVVDGSAPAPTGTLASVYTQGASSLEEFSVELTSDVADTKAQFHRQEPNETLTESPSIAPYFFRNHYIRVPPHDLYEAKISVVSTPHDQVEYGFLITGETVGGSFSYHLTPHFKIVGSASSTNFARHYWWLPQVSRGPCWIVPYTPSGGGEPRCP